MIGWQGLKDVSFWGLGTRLVGHINVPDLELIPERYDPELVDGLEFRAGLELRSLQLSVFLVSKFMPFLPLERFAGIITTLSKLLMRFGTSEGAYALKIQDEDDNSLTWSFVASDGFGVLTPCIASAVMAERIAKHDVEKGARALMGELTLSDVRQCIAEFPFHFHEKRRDKNHQSSLRDAMCDTIVLPKLMREFHLSKWEQRRDDVLTVRGVFDIIRPKGMLANLVATLGGLPRGVRSVETRVDRVTKSQQAGASWRRAFGDQILTSDLSYENGVVMERFRVCFGLVPVAFAFQWIPIEVDSSVVGFRHATKRMYVCGVPVPRFMMLSADGYSSRIGDSDNERISDDGDGWFVRVDVVAPVVGHLVTYKGRIFD